MDVQNNTGKVIRIKILEVNTNESADDRKWDAWEV